MMKIYNYPLQPNGRRLCQRRVKFYQEGLGRVWSSHSPHSGPHSFHGGNHHFQFSQQTNRERSE